MGNSLALCTAFMSSCAASDEHQKVVQVVNTDGKILEFTASILVQDLLLKFPGFSVGVPAKSTPPHESLPLGYELKLGNIYFLFPSLTISPSEKEEQPSTTANSRVIIKTIKLVITTKQLQDLVSKGISLDTVVSSEINMSDRESCSNMDSRWKPRLESVHEGNEFVVSFTN